MTALLALVLAQFSSSLNGQPLTAIVCDGGVVCSRSGSVARIVVTAGGGGGGPAGPAAPVDGGFVVWSSVGSSNERVLSAGTSTAIDTGTAGQIQVDVTSVDLATQATGNLPVARLNGGTGASGTTFWRGDGVWATPPGGGGGGGNFAEVDVAFGAGDELVTVVVTGQAWVTASSRIVCSPTMLATSTRLEAEEDAVVEGLTLAVHSRVAGAGFSVTAAPRQGYAYGTFKVHCTGD
jgi:hypothetical protein